MPVCAYNYCPVPPGDARAGSGGFVAVMLQIENLSIQKTKQPDGKDISVRIFDAVGNDESVIQACNLLF